MTVKAPARVAGRRIVDDFHLDDETTSVLSFGNGGERRRSPPG
ncbi:hypothetical protein [Streptomyces cahuitamycinicus]|nr:hypothetical protein [Streptomyces cahuitamycinicus]